MSGLWNTVCDLIFYFWDELGILMFSVCIILAISCIISESFNLIPSSLHNFLNQHIFYAAVTCKSYKVLCTMILEYFLLYSDFT